MASLDFSKMSNIDEENGVKVPYEQRCELWLNSLNPHKQAFTQRLQASKVISKDLELNSPLSKSRHLDIQKFYKHIDMQNYEKTKDIKNELKQQIFNDNQNKTHTKNRNIIDQLINKCEEIIVEN
jgi:uncharacterized protein YozE (UPF0346 family)